MTGTSPNLGASDAKAGEGQAGVRKDADQLQRAKIWFESKFRKGCFEKAKPSIEPACLKCYNPKRIRFGGNRTNG